MNGSVAYGRFQRPDNLDDRLPRRLQASALVAMYVQLVKAATSVLPVNNVL